MSVDKDTSAFRVFFVYETNKTNQIKNPPQRNFERKTYREKSWARYKLY